MFKTICFLGTDGAGKSTIAKKLVNELTDKGFTVKYLYFGWKPFLFTTKIISSLFRKKGYKIAESMNKKKVKLSIIQELMLTYYYIEYLARYLFQVMGREDYVILDRYFYDMYAHYGYTSKSIVFKHLIKMYPKPYRLFFLDVEIDVAKERKPEMDINLLREHKNKYEELRNIVDMIRIDSSETIEKNIMDIMEKI